MRKINFAVGLKIERGLYKLQWKKVSGRVKQADLSNKDHQRLTQFKKPYKRVIKFSCK